MQIDLIHDISDRMYRITVEELKFINQRVEKAINDLNKTLNILINKIDDIKK